MYFTVYFISTTVPSPEQASDVFAQGGQLAQGNSVNISGNEVTARTEVETTMFKQVQV